MEERNTKKDDACFQCFQWRDDAFLSRDDAHLDQSVHRSLINRGTHARVFPFSRLAARPLFQETSSRMSRVKAMFERSLGEHTVERACTETNRAAGSPASVT